MFVRARYYCNLLDRFSFGMGPYDVIHRDYSLFFCVHVRLGVQNPMWCFQASMHQDHPRPRCADYLSVADRIY